MEVKKKEIKNKKKKIMKLKNKLKEMEKYKKIYENDNANLKKSIGEI